MPAASKGLPMDISTLLVLIGLQTGHSLEVGGETPFGLTAPSQTRLVRVSMRRWEPGMAQQITPPL